MTREWRAAIHLIVEYRILTMLCMPRYLLITSPSKAFGAAQKQASLHSDPSSSKSYINLLPSRTSTHSGTSTEFKFHLSHSPSLSTVNPSKEHNKRKSHTIVETDNNPTTSNTASSANKGWTTFSDNTSITDKPSSNPFQEASQSSSTATSLPTRLKTSTFLLRPINHSIAKSHLANTKQHDHAHAHTKENRRISLRGIAGLFSATDNSFE